MDRHSVIMYGAPPVPKDMAARSLADEMRGIVAAKAEADRKATLAKYDPEIRDAAMRGERDITLKGLSETEEQHLRGAGFDVRVCGLLNGEPNLWRVSW